MLDLFGRFLRLLSVVAGYAILLLMVFTVLDVIFRYVFNAPFRSVYEFTEYMMALIVFFGIPYCGWVGGHVAVDILDRPLENPRLRFIPVGLTVISAVLFLAIAWLGAVEALTSMHRFSNLLLWPHWPFQLSVAFGAAMYAAVLFIHSFQQLRRKS